LKKFRFRELLLLSLPVLIIGAVSWWKGSRERGFPLPRFHNPLDPGPLRVEYGKTEILDPPPYDIEQGVYWRVRVPYGLAGRQAVPSGWVSREFDHVTWSSPDMRLVYRRGNVWKKAQGTKFTETSELGGPNNVVVFGGDWKGVPPDAEEVHLRGFIGMAQLFAGTIPPGWKAPSNYHFVPGLLKPFGTSHEFMAAIKPFDIQIKAPGQPVAVPVVNRTCPLEFKGMRWFGAQPGMSADRLVFQVHYRADLDPNPRSDFSTEMLGVDDLHLYDASGKEVLLYRNQGIGPQDPGNGSVRWWDEDFHRTPEQGDFFASPIQLGLAPRGGWTAVKQPLRIKFKLSDFKFWPLQVRCVLRREAGTPQAIAAFKAQ
jgi:hypothetical protein